MNREEPIIRLLIVDDHQLFRAGLRMLLEARAGLQVVGEASTAEETVRLLKSQPADVVLLDISLPTVNGIAAIEQLSRAAPRAKVLMLSTHKDQEYVARALAAGASGYLLKESSSPDEVVLAARSVVKGDVFVSPALTRLMVKPFIQLTPAAPPLTARQRQVLVLLAQGLTVKQAAARLHLGIKTVETHRAVLMERLGLQTVASLVLYAVRHGLISAADQDLAPGTRDTRPPASNP